MLPDTLQLTSADSVKSFMLMTAPLGPGGQWTIERQPSWIALNPTSGVVSDDPVTITARAVIADTMDTGAYRDTVRISGEGLQSGVLSLSLIVARNPKAAVSPAAIAFGSTTDTASTHLKNVGHGDMKWRVELSQTRWLRAFPDTGTLASGREAVVTFRVDRTGFGPGTYTSSVAISWNAQGFLPSVPLSVSFVVPTVPKLGLASTTVLFPDSLVTRFFEIGNVGTGELTWSVLEKPSWLSISPASGSLGGGSEERLTIGVDRATAPRDVGGSIVLTTNASKSRDTVSVIVTNTPPASGDIRLLDHDVLGAAFARQTGLLLTLAQDFNPSLNGLYLTDVSTGTRSFISIPAPFALAVRADGHAAAVLSGSDVLFVDLDARAIKRTVKGGVQSAVGLVYAANNFLYISDVFKCPMTLTVINAATGAITDMPLEPGPSCYFTRLNAPDAGGILYAIFNFTRRRYDISSGTPSVLWDVTSNVDVDVSWFSRDGSRLIGSGYGSVLQVAATQSNDLAKIGEIATGYSIGSLAELPARQRYYYLRARSVADSVRIADANTLALVGTLPIPKLPVIGGEANTEAGWIFATTAERLVLLTRGPQAFGGSKWAWTLMNPP